MRSQSLNAKPEPIELATKSTAASTMTRFRPQMSAGWPANQAPTAQPMRVMATVIPTAAAPRLNSAWNELTAPLITEVSNPNRRPPSAAARVTPSTLPR
jgi:hypothetical protein